MLDLSTKNCARLLQAEGLLADKGLGRLVPVLEQIVQNGKNRQESIRNLAMKWHIGYASSRRKYYRGVRDLTTQFCPIKSGVK